MQAGRPGGGGVRRRQALHLGDVLPCELLGLELDSSGELDDSAIDPSVENKLSTEAASPAAPAGAGDATCGQPAAAGATAVAAPDSPAPAAEPLPAYTSLARQQLQQRLKAAIAAGTGPAPGAQLGGLLSPAAAVQHHRRPSRAAVLHGGSRQAGTAALPQLDHTKAVQQRCAAPPPANIARPAVPPLAQQTAQPPAAAHGFELPVQGRPRTAACAQQLPCLPAAQRDAAGSAALPSMQAQQAQQGVQRGPLALLLPPLTEQFADILTARLQGADGTTRLLVLPSDGPSCRQEAVTAAAALEQLLADPAGAAHRAAVWREQLLLQSSSAALLGITADYAPQQHARQLRQLGGRGDAACSSSGRSSSSPLAGPAWLAGGSSKGGCISNRSGSESPSTESSYAAAASAAAVDAVRSSSSFLQQLSSASRSSSPLPPLLLPRVPSRLGSSAAAVAAAAAAVAPPVAPMATDSTACAGSLCSLPCAALPGCASGSMAPAACPPLQQQQQAQAQAQQPTLQPHAPPAQQDPAWDAYCRASVAAALTVCMAEAVRQVEVGCAERGRLLAQLWNSYTASLAATVRQQQAQLEELLVANANLSAEASQRRWEASSAEFLRKEINRVRKDKESVALQLEECQQQLAALQGDLDAAGEQQQGLEAQCRWRLAVLRWRWAAAAVLLPRRQVPAMLGCTGLGSDCSSADVGLIQQMLAVEAAAEAVVQVRQQLRDHRHRSRAEAALAAALAAPASLGGSSGGSRVVLAKQHAPSRLGAGSSSIAAAASGQSQPHPLACLRPEARAAVLLSLPRPQRQQALAGMPDSERAALVLHWDEVTRTQALVEMGPALATATDAAIWRKPLLTARLLAGMPADQAAAQLRSRGLTPEQQAAVLEVMPPQQAAALLLGQPAMVQQQLLGSLSARAAAALLEWVPPSVALLLLLDAGGSTAAGLMDSSQSGAAGIPVATTWAAALLPLLPERHVAAMLALAQPAEAAALLHALEPQSQLHLLQQLAPGPRAAAQAALLQLRAAQARQQAVAAAAAAEAGAAEKAEEQATELAGQTAQTVAELDQPGGTSSLDPEPLPALDAATSLLALFQQLSAAEKTHVLLMGQPGVAAPLLLHLQGCEVSDVMLLLPPQRQEALLLALHPAHEQHVRGLMRQATQRRNSLLLPQQVAAAAAAAAAAEAGGASEQQGGEEAEEGSLAGEFQRLRRASSLALQTAVLRRASSLSLSPAGALAAAAAAAQAAGPAARPGSAAGRQRQGSRRGSLLAPAQQDASQQRRGSRCASSLA